MRLQSASSSSLVAALALLQPAVAEYKSSKSATPHDNNADCNCYVVNSGENSNTPEYFQYHRFYDFRTFASGPGQFTNPPGAVSNNQATEANKPVTADAFNSDAWTYDWGIQNWSTTGSEEFPTAKQNSFGNVYIRQNDDASNPFTWLTLRTARSASSFQSTAEIENKQKNLMHVSMRMYAKVTGSAGACAGFFTYKDDKNESDIEILTKDGKDTIHYTNQPGVGPDGNEIPGASQEVHNLPDWSQWHTHRIDWLPQESFWWLDGKQVAKTKINIPQTPSFLDLNMWSDGGSWSGDMAQGGFSEFQIQWIEVMFNTSGSATGKRDEFEERAAGCKTVCKVDGVKTVGTPETVTPKRSVPFFG